MHLFHIEYGVQFKPLIQTIQFVITYQYPKNDAFEVLIVPFLRDPQNLSDDGVDEHQTNSIPIVLPCLQPYSLFL